MGPFRTRELFCVWIGAALLVPPSLGAEALSGASPWRITADKISRFQNPEVVVAEGEVVLKKVSNPQEPASPKGGQVDGDDRDAGVEEMVIKGDWLRFDPQTKVVKVRGRASLDSDEEHITAESAVVDLDDQTGSMSHAVLYFPQRDLLLAGETVEKLGRLVYHFEDGWASRCGPQKDGAPPWSFGWKEADVVAGGFVSLKHVTFRVKDVPMLYSPYLAFSSNQKRKSGLLMPEVSQSGRDGFGFLQPLFLDLSPSADLTFYGGYLTSRGVTGGAEFRYLRDEGTQGRFMVSYLHDGLDDLQEDFRSDLVYRTTENRYWVRGKMNHDFGHKVHGKLDLDLVSDQDYLQEFKRGPLGFDKSQESFRQTFKRGFDSETTFTRTNTAQLSRIWPAVSLSGELRIIDDPTATSSGSHLWSLPRVLAGGRYTPFGGPRFPGPLKDSDLAWDSEYVYYWRENGVGSQRFDIHPRLVMPLHFIPFLESSVSAGVRETVYRVDDNTPGPSAYGSGFLNRTMQDYSATVSTIFLRSFDKRIQGYQHLRHMLRPRLTYDYIPTKGQQDLPNLDGVDHIGAKNLVTYELVNDFDLLGLRANGLPKSQKFLYLNINQSYDLEENGRELTGPTDRRRPFDPVNFDLRFYPASGLVITSDSYLDVYGAGFKRYEILGHYTTMSGYKMGLEYRYNRDEAVDQLNGNLAMQLADFVRFEGDFKYSFATESTSDASLELIYSPECWSMELLAATTIDGDYRFSLMFSLEGIGNVGGWSETFFQ